MTNKKTRLALVLALVAALGAPLIPAEASARKTRPSSGSSSGSSASGGSRASGGNAAISRGRGGGRATGRATYGYYGRGRWHGYGYGYGYHHYPYYWYLGYPGLLYWHWGYPWLFDSWCAFPGSCIHPVYKILRHTADPGAVETDIKPKKAEVLVDGQLVGQARDYNGNWDLLFLKPGLRSIEFRAPGYMTLTLWVEVESGSYIRIKERLAEGEGSDPRSMERPAARKKVAEVAEAGGSADQRELPQGLLRIEATPKDAAIYLDGEFLARADELERLHGALPVARGRHLIEVVRPGYVAESVEIVVEQDEPRKVRIDLARREDAAGD